MRTFFAPGRANLLGEHTDHTDGLVLPAAIDRGITLEVSFGGDVIRCTSDGAEGEVVFPADGSSAPAAGWGRYLAAVAAELADLGRPAVGMRAHLRSDLPAGAGLSSSAALEVVAGLALCAAADWHLPPLELAAACRRAERRATGVPCGIMDQAASLLGRAGQAVLLDCGTLEHRPVPLPDDHVLLVIDSGVDRKLEGSPYAARVEELGAALPALGGRRPADVGVDELPAVLAEVDSAVARRRLRHVVTENARVRAAEQALRAGDLQRVGQLFAEGHASLRDDFEVSIPELDRLVELAVAHGASAARLTGAGFGGAIIALAPEARADAIAAAVVDGYADAFPARAATVHRCLAADGAREL